MYVFDQLVRSMVRAAVGERRHPAHLLNRPHVATRDQRRSMSIKSFKSSSVVRQVGETGAAHRERSVVLRESFGQPQLAGHVGALEIERLERARADALDVPVVEELVCNRVEQPAPVAADRRSTR